MTSQVSVDPVALFAGVRHSICEVEIEVMEHTPRQTETTGGSIVSNPVPVIINFEPPPKLPLDGETDAISNVDVNVAELHDRPRSGLYTTTR